MASTRSNNLEGEIKNILEQVARVKNIAHFEVKPDLDPQIGDGFISIFFNGSIINTESGQTCHVAIKRAPNRELDLNKIFVNEITFYSRVLPALTNLQRVANISEQFDNTAEFFCFGINPKREFIAMENLKARGYILLDKKESMNRKHLEMVFRTFGKFHELSFVLRKQDPDEYREMHQGYSEVYRQLVDNSSKLLEGALSAALDTLDPQAVIYEEVKDIPKYATPTLLKAFTYRGSYRCSIHGDCWSNNMLFKYSESGEPEDIKLVDFQLARDSTPIHDLSFFFYSGATKADFDDIDSYLMIYHNSLSKVIISLGEDPDELFPFDALVKEWKENALLGVILGIHLWQLKLLRKEDYIDNLREKNTTKKTTDEQTAQLFSKLMIATRKTDVYRQRTKDILTHAFEYGVLSKDRIAVD